MHRSIILAIAGCVALGASPLEAASPQLLYVLPPGVQRGHEHLLTFRGSRLSDVEEVLFHHDGVTVKKIKPVDDKYVRVTVEVAPDCRLGEQLVQLRTRSGISDYRSFFVGALPSVDEKEPNNSSDEAQPIEPNVTVAGVLKSEDVDHYRISASKGQRLSVEVEGIRLGQAFFDPYLAILDEDGFEIAACDDTVLARQDPFLSIVVPEDGEYMILVRESAYRGSDNCRYRMHVGNFPRPSVAYPAGGKRGEQVTVQFLGDATGPIEREIVVPDDAQAVVRGSPDPAHNSVDAGAGSGDPRTTMLFIEDEHGVTPSAVPFRSFPHGNVMEQEPNDTFDTATAAELPLALNGRIEREGDEDFFKFTAREGEVWEIECYAQRIGSPLDPVVNVYDANKKSLVGNDDSRKADSYLRWEAPADGDYYLRVKDHLNRGGDTYVYRVEFTPVTPSLKLGIPRVARYSQERQTIVVPRGNRYGTMILATRADFSGPVELTGEALIPGVSFSARPMHPSMNLMPVVFEAAEDAAIGGAVVDLRARLADEEQPVVEGGFENVADFVRGEPNNSVYVAGTIDKIAMAVVEALPFRLEIVEPNVPLVRRGTMNVKVLVHRDEGFDAPVQLRFPFVPRGVGAAGTVNVAKGQNEGLYPLNANATATLGKWPVMVIGAADIDGQAWASSQLAELEIAEPYVSVDLKRAACDQGQPAQIRCELAHNTPFDGTAKAELLGLPPGTSAEPVEFTKDTAEVVFQVHTTNKTPVGKHKSLFCQVSITQDAETIVGTAGTTELQVNAPPAEAESRQPTADSPSKPLSRLEQLRANVLDLQEASP